MTPLLTLIYRYVMALMGTEGDAKAARRKRLVPAYAYAVRRSGSSCPPTITVRRSKEFL